MGDPTTNTIFVVRASDGVNITNLGVSISVTDLAEGQPTPATTTISGTGAKRNLQRRPRQ